jgi:predicted DNA-binding protein (UPF0251 family)
MGLGSTRKKLHVEVFMTTTRKTGQRGKPAGDSHYRATLTDHEVDLMRSLYEAGEMSGNELAAKFQVPRSTVYSILAYSRRNAVVVSRKVVEDEGTEGLSGLREGTAKARTPTGE